MTKELEALKRMAEYRFEAHGVERDDGTDFDEDFEIIKNGLERLEAIENKDQEAQEIYLIYCVTDYHNVYMDYRGKPCNYSGATLFKNKFDAHQFLRNNNQDDYYIWKVVNNKYLTDYEKRRID